MPESDWATQKCPPAEFAAHQVEDIQMIVALIAAGGPYNKGSEAKDVTVVADILGIALPNPRHIPFDTEDPKYDEALLTMMKPLYLMTVSAILQFSTASPISERHKCLHTEGCVMWFEHTNFGGASWTVYPNTHGYSHCTTLQNNWQFRIRSIVVGRKTSCRFHTKTGCRVGGGSTQITAEEKASIHQYVDRRILSFLCFSGHDLNYGTGDNMDVSNLTSTETRPAGRGV
ncbi:hypothetical protein EJ05DRAFT_510827 [Pseudovirgaria hyperparasitica]|uniref:Uncharacterized protein n=1 Tax=Pseudovirgaria hyperparasitica TaxID=470096 RepID=A0A6A6W7N6_9PEZI|nr:uncharacterized protein EJ05DRAFT_510827 [Pseudovirgaria hyperparasitica]KAF2757970.1 hypothetical protein EJ05DRAFT_510827 [Pseudovirgaria hyperparasitica]